MQYSEGKTGRVFVLRIDHGEDVIQTLLRFAGMKGIRSAVVHLLGALAEGRMVMGSEEPGLPPKPHFLDFEGGWDVLGICTIYPGSDGPSAHIHVSVGRESTVHTGCIRNFASAYIVVEAVILEITDLQVRRTHDPKTSQILPSLEHREV